MSNYPIRFGFCLPIFAWPSARLFRTPGFAALDTQRCMQLGALAEQLGYDSLWAADHLMLGHEDAILEGWTVLAAMAGMTHKAQLGIIHYNNVFRHPAFTAKMVSTLDQISNGRMIHFVDLGNNSREYLSYGMHEDDARERRIAQMVEGLELTLRLWSATEPLTFSGTHYFTKDAICNPKPVQEPCPKIWMGEVHPALIDATVKYADAWNSVPVPMSELRKRIEMLDEACVAAERDPESLERTLEIQILIAPTIDALRSKLKTLLALAPSGESPLPDMAAFVSGATDELPEELRESWWAGTPDMVCDRVAECIDLGFTHFMGWFVDAPDDSGMRLFAEQVAPKFRA